MAKGDAAAKQRVQVYRYICDACANECRLTYEEPRGFVGRGGILDIGRGYCVSAPTVCVMTDMLRPNWVRVYPAKGR